MWGIQDLSVWLGYVLCIAATILCVGYALLNWNRGDDQPR